MIMQPGTGTISNYTSYTNNCQSKQMPYRIPVNSLTDVQLYINIGASKPDTVLYQLIHTCGATAGTIETLTTTDYVVGQDSNLNWYGVFKNLISTSAECFVIGITLTTGGIDAIYFSEEYCIENCDALTLIQGCYGNLDNKISYDCEGTYFGTPSGATLGDTSIVYKHQLLIRNAEVSLSAIKNSFKQGRTRNFRTEKEKIFQFFAEFVPEWYLSEIDAVFYRGEVYIGAKKYLLNETAFEKIEDCKRIWKPAATFKESCYQSFSCEPNPCLPPPTVCCDPQLSSVNVTPVPFDSGFGIGSGITVGSGSGAITGTGGIVVVQSVVDGAISVTGTFYPVTGLVNGSLVITSNAFLNVRVFVERGNIQIPGIDPGDGSNFYTKVLTDNFITLNNPLATGEFIYIETIP